MRSLRLAAMLLFSIGCAACSDDAMDPSGPVDLTGSWTLSADAASPPATQACSGDHSGLIVTAFCSAIALNIIQDDSTFAGVSPLPSCGFDYSVSGVVNGNGLSGTLVATDAVGTGRIGFSGSSSGDSAFFEPLSFEAEGLSGDCTAFGRYNAGR